jgi:hypothetical protein
MINNIQNSRSLHLVTGKLDPPFIIAKQSLVISLNKFISFHYLASPSTANSIHKFSLIFKRKNALYLHCGVNDFKTDLFLRLQRFSALIRFDLNNRFRRIFLLSSLFEAFTFTKTLLSSSWMRCCDSFGGIQLFLFANLIADFSLRLCNFLFVTSLDISYLIDNILSGCR